MPLGGFLAFQEENPDQRGREFDDRRDRLLEFFLKRPPAKRLKRFAFIALEMRPGLGEEVGKEET